MKIDDFETHVNPVDLWEGFSYYRVGVLEEVVEHAKGEWSSSVRGPGHRVEVLITDVTITKASCSCPVKSEYCPYIIAALYAIRYGSYSPNNSAIVVPEKVKSPRTKAVKLPKPSPVPKTTLEEVPEMDSVPDAKPEKRPKPAKVPLVEVFSKLLSKIPDGEVQQFQKTYAAVPLVEDFSKRLENVPNNEMREFLMAYAKENHEFRNFFRAHFVQYSAVRRYQYFEELVGNQLQAVFYWGRKVGDEEVRIALIPANRLLKHARYVLNQGDYTLAAVICLAVFARTERFKRVYLGRNLGGTTECITEAYKLLQKISKLADMPRESRLEVFEEFLACACDADYHLPDKHDWEKLLTSLANEEILIEAISLSLASENDLVDEI
jgi:hypothetical protein